MMVDYEFRLCSNMTVSPDCMPPMNHNYCMKDSLLQRLRKADLTGEQENNTSQPRRWKLPLGLPPPKTQSL
jgi:hypothetical protein